MFKLSEHTAQLANLNLRIERHGEDRKLAVDLTLAIKAGNTILDDIEPGLRESLFRAPGKGEQLPLAGDALTAVKFPALAPLKLTHEFPGYELDLSVEGWHDDAAIPLVDVTIKKISVAALEGGSVQVGFTAQTGVQSEDLEDLCDALVRGDVVLTLTPPNRPSVTEEDQVVDGDTLDQQDAQTEAARLIDAGKKAA